MCLWFQIQVRFHSQASLSLTLFLMRNASNTLAIGAAFAANVEEGQTLTQVGRAYSTGLNRSNVP